MVPISLNLILAHNLITTSVIPVQSKMAYCIMHVWLSLCSPMKLVYLERIVFYEPEESGGLAAVTVQCLQVYNAFKAIQGCEAFASSIF